MKNERSEPSACIVCISAVRVQKDEPWGLISTISVPGGKPDSPSVLIHLKFCISAKENDRSGRLTSFHFFVHSLDNMSRYIVLRILWGIPVSWHFAVFLGWMYCTVLENGKLSSTKNGRLQLLFLVVKVLGRAWLSRQLPYFTQPTTEPAHAIGSCVLRCTRCQRHCSSGSLLCIRSFASEWGGWLQCQN